MQELVRFYAGDRIKQHASLRLLWNRLIFLISLLQVYSQGGMVIVFTSLQNTFNMLDTTIHRLQWGIRGSLILFSVTTFVP